MLERTQCNRVPSSNVVTSSKVGCHGEVHQTLSTELLNEEAHIVAPYKSGRLERQISSLLVHRRQSLGELEVGTPRFWDEGVAEGRGVVRKYYHVL